MSRDTLRDCNHGEVETFVGRGVMCRKCGEWATFKGRAALEAEPVGLDVERLEEAVIGDVLIATNVVTENTSIPAGWVVVGLVKPRLTESVDPFYCVVCGDRLPLEGEMCTSCAALYAEKGETCAAHIHVAGPPDDMDGCSSCGHDLRAACHVRGEPMLAARLSSQERGGTDE